MSESFHAHLSFSDPVVLEKILEAACVAQWLERRAQ
jgi:hypothetical protein